MNSEKANDFLLHLNDLTIQKIRYITQIEKNSKIAVSRIKDVLDERLDTYIFISQSNLLEVMRPFGKREL